MTKILLCCSAGMSTSILVKKMQEEARKQNIEVKIEAKSVGEARTEFDNWDIILLGPQVGFMLGQLKNTTKKPMLVIPANIYAMAKGKDTLDLVFKTIPK